MQALSENENDGQVRSESLPGLRSRWEVQGKCGGGCLELRRMESCWNIWNIWKMNLWRMNVSGITGMNAVWNAHVTDEALEDMTDCAGNERRLVREM